MLGIENANQLKLHPLRGVLFENMIVVDLLIENHDGLVPIEIKSGQTITNDYFSSLTEWLKISGEEKG